MGINSVVLLANSKSLYAPQAQVLGQWVPVGDPEYLKIVDVNPITDPADQIDDETRQAFTSEVRPTTRLAIRMAYSSGFTTSQKPTVRLFGAVTDGVTTTGWASVRSLVGELAREMELDSALDLFESSTVRVTTPHQTKDIFDTQGYNVFLLGVEKEWQVSSGSPSTAMLQVRLW